MTGFVVVEVRTDTWTDEEKVKVFAALVKWALFRETT